MTFMDNFANSIKSAGQTKKIIISALLLLFLPALVLVANMQTRQKTSAARNATLSLVPRGFTPDQAGKYTLPNNREVVFDVVLTTGSQAAEALLYDVSYDPTVLSVDTIAHFGCGEAQIAQDGTVTTNPTSMIRYQTTARQLFIDAQNNQTGRLSLLCMSGDFNDPLLTSPSKVPANFTAKVGYIRFKTLKEITNPSQAAYLVDLANSTNGATEVYEYGFFTTDQQRGGEIANAPCVLNNTSVTRRQCERILDTSSLQPTQFLVGTVGGATLSFSSPSTTQTVNQPFDVTVNFTSTTQQIAGVDTYVNFDPAILEVQSVTAPAPSVFSTYNPSPTSGTFPTTVYNNTTGKVVISALVDTGSSTCITGTNSPIYVIHFRPKTTTVTPTSLTFDAVANIQNDSNIAQCGTSNDILQVPAGTMSFTINAAPTVTPTVTNTPTPTRTPTPTPTATRTPTPTPTSSVPTPTGVQPTATRTPTPTATRTPTPTRTPTSTPTPTQPAGVPITIKINLQGRAWTANNMARDMVIKAYAGITEVLNRLFTSSATGEVTDATNLKVPAGTITFLIKPQGYLNRRFTGTAAANTVFDFSADTNALRAGDINKVGSTYGDGIINAFDYSTLLTNFKSESTTNQDVVTADLDGSGQVNSLDFSLMLSNWGNCDVKADGTMDNPTPQVCTNFQ